MIEDINPEHITMAVAVLAPALWLGGLGWWLRSQFSAAKKEMYDYAERVKNETTGAFEKHETLDRERFDQQESEATRRHEDNLSEFRKIFVALAELGWRNGKPIKNG